MFFYGTAFFTSLWFSKSLLLKEIYFTSCKGEIFTAVHTFDSFIHLLSPPLFFSNHLVFLSLIFGTTISTSLRFGQPSSNEELLFFYCENKIISTVFTLYSFIAHISTTTLHFSPWSPYEDSNLTLFVTRELLFLLSYRGR